jgi:hypothetical protein
MRLRYARWQGFVAAAAILAFIVATHWRYPGVGVGVGLAIIVLLKGGEWLVRRFANRSAKPS